MTVGFGAKCSQCNVVQVFEIADGKIRAAIADPVAGLRSLPKTAQMKIADFYDAHAKLGHDVEPILCEIQPLPQKASN